jgi:16S rRNA (guanine527-N7)-methyltransferase
MNTANNFITLLTNGCQQLNVALDTHECQQIVIYIETLIKWNKVHNLTAIEDPEEIITKHILDSLSIVPFLKDAKTIIDVGTGAGFPGIPLAIALPDKQFTLLDSSQKKTTFLIHVVGLLGLKNVKVVCKRVEEFHPQVKFDVSITRAFSSLKEALAMTTHLSNQLFAMKGKYPVEELQEIMIPFTTHKLTVPGLAAERWLIVF